MYGSCLSLIGTYLVNRKQTTVLYKDGMKLVSKWKDVTFGVSQGSTLGPFFLMTCQCSK